MLRLLSFCTILCGLMVLPAYADVAPPKTPSTTATVAITNAVLQLPIPGTHNSAAFLQLTNKGATPLTLVGVSSSAAAKVQLHSHSNVDGMMRMRPVESIAIAPGKTLLFESGGFHIMLFDMQSTIASGDTVVLTLEFEGGATKTVQATVTSRYDGADHSHHH